MFSREIGMGFALTLRRQKKMPLQGNDLRAHAEMRPIEDGLLLRWRLAL
jgi:hypothetical protein